MCHKDYQRDLESDLTVSLDQFKITATLNGYIIQDSLQDLQTSVEETVRDTARTFQDIDSEEINIVASL